MDSGEGAKTRFARRILLDGKIVKAGMKGRDHVREKSSGDKLLFTVLRETLPRRLPPPVRRRESRETRVIGPGETDPQFNFSHSHFRISVSTLRSSSRAYATRSASRFTTTSPSPPIGRSSIAACVSGSTWDRGL